MRILLLFIYSFIFITLLGHRSFAQGINLSNLSNLKVSQASDEQIVQAWKRLESSGISEQDAYKLLLQRGLPPTEVEALKNRITLLGLNKKQGTKPTAEPQAKDNARNAPDTTVAPAKPDTKPAVPQTDELMVYGTDFFNQSAVKFEPNNSLATPKGYVLGPGDEVIVLVTGLNETSVRTKVTPEGNLQIPYAGLIYVNGFTIEQATSLVKTRLTRVYPALTSGQTQLAVNLGSTRSIRITITGEVKTPGSYTLSSLSTLYNALHTSGGPTANGTLRYIQLIRNNKVYRTVDFYGFLQRGLLDGNIRLEDQDVIFIPVYRKRVGIKGEVKRPAIYELKENESLQNLVNYAGGYTDVAYKGIAKIDQISALEREVKDVPSSLFENYTPRNGDLVQIGAITNRYTNRITLEGAVYRPGIYELSAGFTLKQLLANAQGLKPEAYTERGYIKRTLPNLEKDFISFVPSQIISGRYDIPLLREDSVVILDRNIFVSNQNVTINGFVRNPATFTYRKGLKLADVIAMAGGFNDEAADHHIEISRIIKNESDNVANQLVQTFIVNFDSLSTTSGSLELQPMDYIYVPRLVNYRSLGNVSVTGEVVFPGEYAVQKRDETAQEFLKRAGGVTPYGSTADAQVYRKGVRVNLDLTNKNLSEKDRRNMILLPGDSVHVPRVISYVEVAGAVNNPQYVSYSGKRFKYYINAAAGVTQNARLKGAYIKYPNGLNQPVKRFLFFRNYPSVKPGSKIIVPEKTPDNRIKINFGDLAGIATALTAIVSLLAVLRN